MKNVKLFKEFLWDKRGWGFRIMISWFFVVVLVFGVVLDGIEWCGNKWTRKESKEHRGEA